MAKKTSLTKKDIPPTAIKGTVTMEMKSLEDDFREIYTCTHGEYTFTFETDGRWWLLTEGDSVLKGDVAETVSAKMCVVTDCRYTSGEYPKQVLFIYYPATSEFVLDRPKWFE